MFADALIPIGNCCVMCAGKCCALGGLLDWVCLEILEDGEKLTIRLLRGVPVGHVPRLNRNRTSRRGSVSATVVEDTASQNQFSQTLGRRCPATEEDQSMSDRDQGDVPVDGREGASEGEEREEVSFRGS